MMGEVSANFQSLRIVASKERLKVRANRKRCAIRNRITKPDVREAAKKIRMTHEPDSTWHFTGEQHSKTTQKQTDCTSNQNTLNLTVCMIVVKLQQKLGRIHRLLGIILWDEPPQIRHLHPLDNALSGLITSLNHCIRDQARDANDG